MVWFAELTVVGCKYRHDFRGDWPLGVSALLPEHPIPLEAYERGEVCRRERCVRGVEEAIARGGGGEGVRARGETSLGGNTKRFFLCRRRDSARARVSLFFPVTHTRALLISARNKRPGYGRVSTTLAERGAMEQDPPNSGAFASTTSGDDGGGGGGDSSVGKVKSNNQEEDDEEGEREDSAYGSGDFDEQSKAGATESVRVCALY